MTARFAIIDTETSGLFDFRKPADDPAQPRLAQLGMILLPDGVDGPEVVHGFYVRPDGWEMAETAEAVNGLSQSFLADNGVPVAEVLDAYAAVIDAGYVIAAWNAQFDLKMMRGELRRAGRADLFEDTPNVCLMRAATDIVAIPAKNGRGNKFPKLSEACAHFGVTNERAHDALGDCRAALEIMRRLADLGALPDGQVHFAREGHPARESVA